MDQNFDNIPENQETQPVPDTADENQQKGTDQQYTDPNSGAGQTYQGNYYYDTGAGQTATAVSAAVSAVPAAWI